MTLRLLLSSLLVLLTFGALPDSARAETRIVVQSGKPGPTIHKDVYGQFAEHLGRLVYDGIWVGEGSSIPNVRGFRTDVIEALKELHVPVVRWPGGCYADMYHWRNGIGPRNRRGKTVNASWGGEEDNAFGTHEFFDLVEMIGADAYVNVNVGTGSPREMVEWVEYMTSDSNAALANLRRRNGRQKPWRLHYLGIGNEAWGCGGSMSPEHYADVFKRFATFLKTPQDNRPIVVASGGHGQMTEWTETLLKNVKPSWTLAMHGIAHHYYTLPTGSWSKKGAALGFAEDEWFSTLFRTFQVRSIFEKNVRVMDKLDPEKKVGFFLDEWGTWSDAPEGGPKSALYQQNSLRDAVLAALNFHVFHEYAERVRMTNIAQMVNVLQAMILTEGKRMLRTPTYHAFHLYRPFQNARRVPIQLGGVPDYRSGKQSLPKVSATAAIAEDGKLLLGLVNAHPSESEKVCVEAKEPLVAARGRVLTGDALDAHNTFDAPDRVQPTAVVLTGERGRLEIALPPRSIMVLSLE
jgi:alpha-N-arabinofuranosidase